MKFSKQLSKLPYIAFFMLSACSHIDNAVVIQHENGSALIDMDVDKRLSENIPQDLNLFKDQLDAVAEEYRVKQQEYNKKFDSVYFSPWNDNITPDICEDFTSRQFCNNMHLVSDKDIEDIQHNVSNRSNIMKKGIVLCNTMAYRWPTDLQLFSNLRNPGDSFPFDANIQSMLKLGYPVFVIAQSADKKWLYIKSYICSGWVPSQTIAYVSDDFVTNFRALKLHVSTKDDAIITKNGEFIASANIGTILPILNQQTCNLLCPWKKVNGEATLIKCDPNNAFVEKPVPFTAENVLDIANQLINQKYGWGGYLNLRDCSMFTMDFFTVFGMFTYRNANAQLKMKGYIDIIRDKQNTIMSYGKPFQSIVGKKGHVMLYVGIYNNRPVFLHNMWSITKKSPACKSRYIVGKTVLTTYDFGSGIISDDNIAIGDACTLMVNF